MSARCSERCKAKEQSEHINKAIAKPILKDFAIDSINTHNLLEPAQQNPEDYSSV